MSLVRAGMPSLPGGAALRSAAVAMLVTALGAMPAAGQSEPGRENRVVLRVNDRIVTLYEYQMRSNIVRGREVAPRVDLADEDLRGFYRDNEERFAISERARLEEVVILEGVVPADRMAPLASLARTRLMSGEAAADVAEGLGEGATAVDVGWITPGDLAAELDAVAWDLQTGEVAEAVTARGGLHVLKMLEREPASVQPFEDVRDAIERQERGRLFDEEFTLYMEELADAAYIVERLPEEAVGYRPVATQSLDVDALGLLSRFGPDADVQNAAEPAAEETDDAPDARP